MRVLVACEFSGIVRDAFCERGHDAWSCDIVPSESSSDHHIQTDVLSVLDHGWDMMIGHPPCQHLAVSGARWFKDKVDEQRDAINFFMALVNAPIRRICIENPVCIMSTKYRKPDQVIHPWMFGHGEMKMTCLWLKELPKLQPTCIVDGRYSRIEALGPSPSRQRERSRTYRGIAAAMAEQWG